MTIDQHAPPRPKLVRKEVATFEITTSQPASPQLFKCGSRDYVLEWPDGQQDHIKYMEAEFATTVPPRFLWQSERVKTTKVFGYGCNAVVECVYGSAWRESESHVQKIRCVARDKFSGREAYYKLYDDPKDLAEEIVRQRAMNMTPTKVWVRRKDGPGA